jgi:hypothetical protein
MKEQVNNQNFSQQANVLLGLYLLHAGAMRAEKHSS